jgi:hypothetical protein
MTVYRLASAAATAGERYYLDTSALYPLMHAEMRAANLPADSDELRRAAALKGFLQRVRAVNGALRTSVLAFEEIGAKARSIVRSKGAEKTPYRKWSDLKRADATAAAAVDADAQAHMLDVMRFAADGAGKEGVLLERSIVLPTDTTSAAEKLRKAHRKLLREYRSLDAMDALHIAVGLELAIRNFITFDVGWQGVPGINVYAI